MLIRFFAGVCFLGFGTMVPAADFPEPYNTEKDPKPPMSAEEAAKTAKLPDSFRLEVFASEPQVQQPISIAFDDQERLWVAECYTFAERPMRWDLDLRDRILVLEDTDKDGKADKRTVFWDEGIRMTCAIPGYGGVWATCAPHLLFIPDADNDLVPDGEAQIMLTGFDAEAIGHNIVNGLKWGPDGWLYGRHGITATSHVGTPGTPKSERVALNCSIWRFHPERKVFEVFCNGGTNPWGLDWDRNGQLFYTNTVIGHLWHAIPGAYYTRMFGTHLNQHAYELIPHTADHYHWDTGAEKWNEAKKDLSDSTSAFGGGHAHMGCLIYEGGVWPQEYHGDLFACNLHGRRINRDHLKRENLGYVAEHGKDFLFMEDPWFRGLDLITGPDGQVWMNDWSDTGECHDNDAIHRTSGRIYRIVYDGPDKGTPKTERPEWLTKRADPEFGRKDIELLLASGEEAKVAMGIRWLSEDAGEDPATPARLIELASGKHSGLVRIELAASLGRLPGVSKFDLADKLVAGESDAADRQQSLMIWYGIEPVVTEFPDRAVSLAANSKLPTVSRLISRRLVEEMDETPGPVEALLSQVLKNGESMRAVLDGLAEGLEGWSKAKQPKSWPAFAKAFESDSESAETIRTLSIVFGDGRARDDLLAIAQNQEADSGARQSALRSLLQQPDDKLLPLVKRWVTDRIMAGEAIRGLVAFDDPGVAETLIKQWNRYPPHHVAAIETLVSRSAYAMPLLEAVERGQIPSAAISPSQARQLVNLNDEAVTAKLNQVWGSIRETPAEKKAEIASWKKLLSSEAIKAANPANGKLVFSQSCGACHRFYGEGGKIGPDLTGSDRHSLDYLLENTINPNDVIPADYRLTVFTMKDGRVVSGVVPEENQNTVTVQTAADRVIVSVDEITKRETLPVSLMPEGLLKALGEDSVTDLVAYLMTKTPITE